MVQPLSGEASGKQYQSPVRVTNGGAENREVDSFLESQRQLRAWISGHG